MSNTKRLPRHVAIIMDGNGRWAQKRGLPRSAGHREGAMALRRLIGDIALTGIEVLSVYAFSTENWSRPRAEIDALFGMIAEFFSKHINELIERNVRVRLLGELSALPKNTREFCLMALERTSAMTGMTLNIALNYGGRDEIVRAAKAIGKRCKNGEFDIEQLDEALFAQHLYTNGQPDVDLVIRTSGESRLSGFLLYQCAYAEFYAEQALFPDYTAENFRRALADYAARNRRFGGIDAEAEA